MMILVVLDIGAVSSVGHTVVMMINGRTLPGINSNWSKITRINITQLSQLVKMSLYYKAPIGTKSYTNPEDQQWKLFRPDNFLNNFKVVSNYSQFTCDSPHSTRSNCFCWWGFWQKALFDHLQLPSSGGCECESRNKPFAHDHWPDTNILHFFSYASSSTLHPRQ